MVDRRFGNRPARSRRTLVRNRIAQETRSPTGVPQRPSIHWLSVLLVLFFFSNPGAAGEIGVGLEGGADSRGCSHFVHPDGDDASPGTADAPWRTFKHAVESAPPGAIVCLVPLRTDQRTGIDLLTPGTSDLAGRGLKGDFGAIHKHADRDHLPGIENVNAVQSYVNPWWTIAAGGGNSQGCIFNVTGTVGQAGVFKTMAEGNTSVTGGFWAGIPPSEGLFADSFECSDTSRWGAVMP